MLNYFSNTPLDKDPYWIVPPLWQSEFRNALASYLRRGMDPQDAKLVMRNVVETLGNRQVIPSEDEVFELIAHSGFTAYDFEFVALAKQLNVSLVTADKQLLREFPDCTISLEDFPK